MAKIETTAFDSADYLNTAERIAAYLDAYLEDSSLPSFAGHSLLLHVRTGFLTLRSAAA